VQQKGAEYVLGGLRWSRSREAVADPLQCNAENHRRDTRPLRAMRACAKVVRL
jgi:hypothetical protein